MSTPQPPTQVPVDPAIAGYLLDQLARANAALQQQLDVVAAELEQLKADKPDVSKSRGK